MAGSILISAGHRLRLGQYFGLIILAASIVVLIAAASGVPESLAARLTRSDITVGAAQFSFCVHAKQVDCVIDGDTLRTGGMTIRLADIDAPETHAPKCASKLALGNRATERLLELMNLGPYEIAPYSRDKDKYGRALRLVTRNGISIAQTLVAEGLARPWDGKRHPWCV